MEMGSSSYEKHISEAALSSAGFHGNDEHGWPSVCTRPGIGALPRDTPSQTLTITRNCSRSSNSNPLTWIYNSTFIASTSRDDIIAPSSLSLAPYTTSYFPNPPGPSQGIIPTYTYTQLPFLRYMCCETSSTASFKFVTGGEEGRDKKVGQSELK